MKNTFLTLALLLCSTAMFGSDPCCGIKSIDLKTGVVTAADVRSGKTFEFTLTNASLLRSLKVGEAIDADFAKNFAIVRTTERVPLRVTAKAKPFEPCCGVTSINLKTGVVTATPYVGGTRAFEFTITNPTLLRSLKTGDPLDADFTKNFATLKSGDRFLLRLVPKR